MLDKRYEKFRPVPVSWNGVDFKSTLEARLAILYEALNFDFTYEPLTFDLRKVKGIEGREVYTPDFLIVGSTEQILIEAKGPEPTEQEILIAQAVFAKYSFPIYFQRYMFDPVFDKEGMRHAYFMKDKPIRWIECVRCNGVTRGIEMEPSKWTCIECHERRICGDRTPKIMAAYDRARTYNFHAKGAR